MEFKAEKDSHQIDLQLQLPKIHGILQKKLKQLTISFDFQYNTSFIEWKTII